MAACSGFLVVGTLLLFGTATRLTAAQDAEPILQQQAEQELRALHQADRRAHLSHDVKALVAHAAESLIDVRDGKVQRLTREQIRERFAEYFRRANFIAWDDVEPAIVRASPDGRLGWMIVRVHIAYDEKLPSRKVRRTDSVLAWMAAYEKRNGEWIMTAVTTTGR
jgi:ketosteroid isomerase-like protein